MVRIRQTCFKSTEDTGHGQGYLGSTNFTEFPGNVKLDGFELLNVSVPNAHDKYPQMTALRERLARQAPDGTWQRIYGLCDGSVQTATSYDGNFDAWEKSEHLFTTAQSVRQRKFPVRSHVFSSTGGASEHSPRCNRGSPHKRSLAPDGAKELSNYRTAFCRPCRGFEIFG